MDYPKSTRPFKGFPTSLSNIKKTRSRVTSFVTKTSATCKGEMEASTRNLGRDHVPYQEEELLYMGKLGRSFYPPYAHSRMRPHSQAKGRTLCHDIAKERSNNGFRSRDLRVDLLGWKFATKMRTRYQHQQRHLRQHKRVSTPPSTTKAEETRKVLNKQVTYVSYDNRLGSDNN